MPIELEKKIIKTQRTLSAKGTRASLNADIIVPDTQPDVKKVLQAELLPMICEKHVQRDYIILSGNADYSIIYLSEQDTVKSISTRVPFTHQIEATGVQEADFTGIKADVASVSFAAVNSRKINIKSEIEFESNIICTEEFDAVSGAVCEAELPCRTQEIHSFSLKAYAENEFEVNDIVSIASGSEMIEDILKVDVSLSGKEIKSISGKPVAKGELKVKVLYCDTAGTIQSADGVAPFTEVLSIDDVWGGDLCESEYSLTDLAYSIAADSDDDASLIEIRAKINAATCVFEQITETVTEDMYSPDFDIALARDKAKVTALACGTADRSVIKDTISISADHPPIAKVYNVVVKPYVESAEIEGGKAQIAGAADTYIEYISAIGDSPVYTYKGEIPFDFNVTADCSKDAQISVICEAEDISFSAASSSTVDVKFNLNWDTKILEEKEVSYIKDAEAAENGDYDKTHMPAVIIYFAAKGEKMWDIAKRYHTTEDKICSANGCDFGDVLAEPKKIMIPR